MIKVGLGAEDEPVVEQPAENTPNLDECHDNEDVDQVD